jgi:large subunit ribosomal protein L16
MLIPQFRKYKKINRKTLRSTYELKSCQLKFASMGLQAIEKGLLTGKQIEAVRRTITGRLKRRAKVWIRCYPDYPITRKPREVRMGRGKGAVDS